MKRYEEFQGNIDMDMSEEEVDRAFDRFHAQLHQKRRRGGRYFGTHRYLAAACAALLCLAVGGSIVAGAEGKGVFGRFLAASFSKTPDKTVSVSDLTVKDSRYQVTLSHYYLDPLGFGQCLFEVSSLDGKAIDYDKQDSTLKYKHQGKLQEFDDYFAEYFYKDEDGEEYTTDSADGPLCGIQTRFLSTDAAFYHEKEQHSFHPEEDTLVFRFDGHDYEFSSLEVTAPELLEWETEKGKISLSEMGAELPEKSALGAYLEGFIKKAEMDVAHGTVYYQDGSSEDITMSTSFYGKGRRVVRFSPMTELYRSFQDAGWAKGKEMTEEEVREADKLWEYSFTSFYFSIKDIDHIQFGDITLKASEAE